MTAVIAPSPPDLIQQVESVNVLYPTCDNYATCPRDHAHPADPIRYVLWLNAGRWHHKDSHAELTPRLALHVTQTGGAA